MSRIATGTKPATRNHGPLKAILLTLPVMLFSYMLLFGGNPPSGAVQTAALAATYLFLNILFFLMVYTGKTYRYRSLLFIVIAFSFVFTFIPGLLETRGNVALTAEDIYSGRTPFCHLAIPMIIIPAAMTGTVIFPGSMLGGYAPVAVMLVIWLGASLALGRGWCSWVCFFGGMDEGFSRVRKRALIKNIDRRFRHLPYAVLLAVVLTSAVALTPTYCEWLCPFKAVTEFAAVDSIKVLVQTIIFVTLFIGLVVVLPILTRRRIQCGLFCPLAAVQSLVNRINIFQVRVDTTKCTGCGLCEKSCPTFSIDGESIKKGCTLSSCTKCGLCADLCPRGAVSFRIRGTPVALNSDTARLLFLYPAYVFAAAMGGGIIYGALLRLIKLVTTGSII